MLPIIETIGDALKQDKYAMKLSVQETKFMHNLLQDHPEVFRKIQGIVDEIMSDGKVDIFDLPNLIRLCSQIYHEHLIGYAIQHVGVISLIQFTLDALLDSGILPINGVAKDILKKVVDSSLELLNANVSSIPYKTHCLRLSKFFKCTKKPTTTTDAATATAAATTTTITLTVEDEIVEDKKKIKTKSCDCVGCNCVENNHCGCVPKV